MDDRLRGQSSYPRLALGFMPPSVGHGLYYDGYPSEIDPQRSLFSQTLESVFSRLNLVAEPHRQPPPPPANVHRHGGLSGVADFPIGSEGFAPLPFQANPSSHGSRFQHSEQMAFGGAHKFLTVGEELEGSGPGFPPTGTIGLWPEEAAVSSSFGFYPENNGSFLQRKKQLGNQLNFDSPSLPCSSRSSFFPDSDQLFDRSSSYSASQSIHRLPQIPQFPDCFSLGDLRGQIISWAKDPERSRVLQKKLEDPKEDEIDMVLYEVIDRVGELMVDHCGNYFVQKLIKACNEKQRTRIVFSLTKSEFQLTRICLHPLGTRAAQKLLEHVTTQQQISLVTSALSNGTVALATDPNGHHVIQYCAKCFSDEDNKHILNEMAKHCYEVATNKSGCCVLQTCVDHSLGEYRDRIVAEIIANALPLAEDPYGNYVVQHLLVLKNHEITKSLLKQLQGSYMSLSCNKYASNVVEKCLNEVGEEQSSWITIELLRNQNCNMLLVDPYGNFVIQSALKVSKGLILETLIELIRKNQPFMHTNLFGKKVLALYHKMKLHQRGL